MPDDDYQAAERVTAGELAKALDMLTTAVALARERIAAGGLPAQKAPEIAEVIITKGDKLCPSIPAPNCGFSDAMCKVRVSLDPSQESLEQLMERITQLLVGCAVVSGAAAPDLVLWKR